ncbi:MAG: DNA polymerase II [Polyangiaceae bacterium]
MTVRALDAFLLSRTSRDTERGIEVVLWARAAEGPVCVRVPGQEAVMFVPRHVPTSSGRRVERPLTSLRGEDVDAVYFRSQTARAEERERLHAAGRATLESDVKTHERFLMERFVTASFRVEGPCVESGGVLRFDAPKIRAVPFTTPLRSLAIDIETRGLGDSVVSAALSSGDHAEVFVDGDAPVAWRDPSMRGRVTFVRGEAELLRAFFAAVVRADPDVLVGWNVVDFDLAVLEARARARNVPFVLGRSGERAKVLAGTGRGMPSVARVPGRVVLDGIATLRSATWSFERYTLEAVSRELLGRGKKIEKGPRDAVDEILRMLAEDREALAVYNLEDCRLVEAIFAKADLLAFAMERARLTGLAMDRQGGSVAAFDHLYLPRLHRRHVVAEDVGTGEDAVASPGGHVLESVPGLYEDILSFDFRSLYPSIIRTFGIDPLGLARPGEDPLVGESVADEPPATFAREGAILPEIVTTLHDARSEAMARGNAALSRAIKIVMNSFYGVLGTPGCRFFDPRLPTSITRRGHAIIERARAHFESAGFPVVYGDTDSLFVHAKGERVEARRAGRSWTAFGRDLASEFTDILGREILATHRVASHLELRFESHYVRYLMPTTRGADRGSKKRYAGLARAEDGTTKLVIRGLEAVRRDWSPLARRVQSELFRRAFEGEPFDVWLRDVVRDLHAGLLDDELVFEKRIRREGRGEASGRGLMPHMAALRKLEGAEGPAPRSEIAYVMTVRGAEPVRHRTSPLDYGHYVERQLAPVCDVLLPFLGTSFVRVAGLQTSLF